MPKLPSKVRGKYQVCVKGKRQGFGVVGGVRKPDGIIVHADGRCVFSEYAGGFDGFWSTDAGDGHEDGLALAAKRVRTHSSPLMWLPLPGFTLTRAACALLPRWRYIRQCTW